MDAIARAAKDKLDHFRLGKHHAMDLSTTETIMYALPFILIPNLVGMIGAFANRPGLRSWYRTLRKPWFTPPDWIFSVVWPILYALIGTATFLIWRDTGGFSSSKGRVPLTLFVVNIILNGLWSPVFFGLGKLNLAYIIHIGVYVTAWLTWFQYRSINMTAALLFLPYLAWLTYAGILQLWMFLYTTPPSAAEVRGGSGQKKFARPPVGYNSSTTSSVTKSPVGSPRAKSTMTKTEQYSK